MSAMVISAELRTALKKFFKTNRKPELVNTYLFYLEKRFQLQPVVVPKAKYIYQSIEHAIKKLEAQNALWHQTEIKISFNRSTVSEHSTKIYICPFTGKAFGNNAHPNPQDAIYDWVSKAPENTERRDGLKVKRFFVSEDPEVIKNYITERKKPITKTVFCSLLNGKLFNSLEAIIEDFKATQVKKLSLIEVQNQNRFEIEPKFMEFLQTYLDEEKIAEFVGGLAQVEEFSPYISHWLEEDEEEDEEQVDLQEES